MQDSPRTMTTTAITDNDNDDEGTAENRTVTSPWGGITPVTSITDKSLGENETVLGGVRRTSTFPGGDAALSQDAEQISPIGGSSSREGVKETKTNGSVKTVVSVDTHGILWEDQKVIVVKDKVLCGHSRQDDELDERHQGFYSGERKTTLEEDLQEILDIGRTLSAALDPDDPTRATTWARSFPPTSGTSQRAVPHLTPWEQGWAEIDEISPGMSHRLNANTSLDQAPSVVFGSKKLRFPEPPHRYDGQSIKLFNKSWTKMSSSPLFINVLPPGRVLKWLHWSIVRSRHAAAALAAVRLDSILWTTAQEAWC
jgi:hypothetical protein